MVAVSPRAGQIFVFADFKLFLSLSGAKTGGFWGMHWQMERALRVWDMGGFGATKALEADDVQSTCSRFGSVTVSTTIPGVARLANWRENLFPSSFHKDFQGCILLRLLQMKHSPVYAT